MRTGERAPAKGGSGFDVGDDGVFGVDEVDVERQRRVAELDGDRQ